MPRLRLWVLALALASALLLVWRNAQPETLWRVGDPSRAFDLDHDGANNADDGKHKGVVSSGDAYEEYWEPYVVGPPTASLFGASRPTALACTSPVAHGESRR
jgi:hypothetical protein